VRRLGADEVFDARSTRRVDRLRELAPDGVDAVFALAGGDELQECLTLVRNRGRVIFPNGVEPAPRGRKRFRLIAFDAKTSAREFAELARWIKAAKLRVPVAAVHPLSRAAAAHKRLERGRVIGRIVLAI
jgi:NADPH2:quinone reductase